MRWQYRTLIFEFQKDGLLGDRYIDDEEMEKTLNEQGRAGWELVSATMVQDGLLTLLKRPDRSPLGRSVEETDQGQRPDRERVSREVDPYSGDEEKGEVRKEPVSGNLVGSIRIR